MLPTNLPKLSNTHQIFKFYILPYTAVIFDDNLKEFKIDGNIVAYVDL